jgi:hypothetical protein
LKGFPKPLGSPLVMGTHLNGTPLDPYQEYDIVLNIQACHDNGKHGETDRNCFHAISNLARSC